jgi:hypothetical protein
VSWGSTRQTDKEKKPESKTPPKFRTIASYGKQGSRDQLTARVRFIVLSFFVRNIIKFVNRIKYMDTKVSYRNLGIENPQNGPKTASTAFILGEWLQFTSGLLAPLAPATAIVGLNLTPVLATDATTDLITFDGINSTEDRFVMPVNGTIVNPVTAVGSGADIYSDSISLDATTIGTGTQFVITQVIKAVADAYGPALVEVAVKLLAL